MIGSLRCDFHKTIISAGFAAAVLVTFLLCFTENVYIDGSMRAYSALEALFTFDRPFMESRSSFCSLAVFKSTLSGYSAMFLPILASFPFVFSHSAERNSSNIRFSIFRAKRLKYYLSKFICAALSGGACVLLGVSLFGIFSSIAFPALECYEGFDLEFFAPDGVVAEIIKKLLSAFIYGCANAPRVLFERVLPQPLHNTLRSVSDAVYAGYGDQKILVSTYDDKIYQRVFPFESYAPSKIPYLDAGELLYSTIAVTAISAGIFLVGYIIIMERRTDKGE